MVNDADAVSPSQNVSTHALPAAACYDLDSAFSFDILTKAGGVYVSISIVISITQIMRFFL